MMLVGLAGTTPQLQSCAIRALIFNMKQSIQLDLKLRGDSATTVEDAGASGKLASTDP